MRSASHSPATATVSHIWDQQFGNLVAIDFDDVQVMRVVRRDFRQQPDEAGLHLSFSVSWHAIGKTRKDAHDALEVLLPDEGDG